MPKGLKAHKRIYHLFLFNFPKGFTYVNSTPILKNTVDNIVKNLTKFYKGNFTKEQF